MQTRSAVLARISTRRSQTLHRWPISEISRGRRRCWTNLQFETKLHMPWQKRGSWGCAAMPKEPSEALPRPSICGPGPVRHASGLGSSF